MKGDQVPEAHLITFSSCRSIHFRRSFFATQAKNDLRILSLVGSVLPGRAKQNLQKKENTMLPQANM
jgi:hypothetical protein